MLKTNFGYLLAERIKELKITQNRAAEMCDVSIQNICYYRAHVHEPRIALAMKICRGLAIDPLDIKIVDKYEPLDNVQASHYEVR